MYARVQNAFMYVFKLLYDVCSSNRFDQRIGIGSLTNLQFSQYTFICMPHIQQLSHSPCLCNVCCVRYLSYNCNQFFAFHFWGSSNSCKCKYLNAFIRFLHVVTLLALSLLHTIFMRLRIFNNIYLFNVTCSCANICVSKSFSNKTKQIVRNWPRFEQATKSLPLPSIDYAICILFALIASMLSMLLRMHFINKFVDALHNYHYTVKQLKASDENSNQMIWSKSIQLKFQLFQLLFRNLITNLDVPVQQHMRILDPIEKWCASNGILTFGQFIAKYVNKRNVQFIQTANQFGY